jgi:hypothetical protein
MKRKIKIALAALVLIIVTVSLARLRQPREPEYDGHPLSYYLSSLTYSQVRLEGNARNAIRDIGSNAVPSLIRILDARESRFKTSSSGFARWVSRKPRRRWLARSLARPRPPPFLRSAD